MAGGDPTIVESPTEPKWSDEGELFFVTDRKNGFWNLHKWVESDNTVAPIYSLEAEFAGPLWVFGMNSYEIIKEHRNLIACNYRRSYLKFWTRILQKFIEFPTEVPGEMAYAYYYEPTNLVYQASQQEKPPLLLKSHGYGRAFRERLLGKWGIVDVDDCCSYTQFLVNNGKADGERLCIIGGCAGGCTTLAALAFKKTFKAGASLYGDEEMEHMIQFFDSNEDGKIYLEKIYFGLLSQDHQVLRPLPKNSLNIMAKITTSFKLMKRPETNLRG